MRSSGTGSSKKQGSFSIEDEDAGATRLMIDTFGNIGIGTDTPVKTLHVAGTIRADTFEKGDGMVLGNQQTVIVNNVSGAINFGTNMFVADRAFRDFETDAIMILPVNGTISDFYINVSSNGLNNTTNIKLRTKGADRITFSYSSGEIGMKSSLGNNISFSAGDTLTVQVDASLSTS